MSSPFTTKTLTFLRALTRNNDREWFREHKRDYDRHVREPMIELLARLAVDLWSFAPELVSDPKVSLYRIYRDTRFSADKSPLKTHVAAHFPSRAFPRGAGAGLYLEIGPKRVWIGGGLYMPSTQDLQAIREHIAATHPRLHRLVHAAGFTRTVGALEGERLTRLPRGYAAGHKAGHYLQFKQFYAGCEYDAAFATTARFYVELLQVFRAVTPLVRFLNVPLAGRLSQAPLLAEQPARRNRRQSATHVPARTPMW